MKTCRVFFSKLLIVAMLVSLLAPVGALATENEAVLSDDSVELSEALPTESEETVLVASAAEDVSEAIAAESEAVSGLDEINEEPAEPEISAGESLSDSEPVGEAPVEEAEVEFESADEPTVLEGASEPEEDGDDNVILPEETVQLNDGVTYTLQCDLGTSWKKPYLFVLQAECETADDTVQVKIYSDGCVVEDDYGYFSLYCNSASDAYVCQYEYLRYDEIPVGVSLGGNAKAQLTVYDISSLPVSELTAGTSVSVSEIGLFSLPDANAFEYSLTVGESCYAQVVDKSYYSEIFSPGRSVNTPCANWKLSMNDSDCTYFLLILPLTENGVNISLQAKEIPVYNLGEVSVAANSSAFVAISEPDFYTITAGADCRGTIYYNTHCQDWLWGEEQITVYTGQNFKIVNESDTASNFVVSKATATPITEKTDLQSGVLYSFSIEQDGTYVFLSDNNSLYASLYKDGEAVDYISDSIALSLTSGTYEFVSENPGVTGFYFKTLSDVATEIELNKCESLSSGEDYNSVTGYYKVTITADGWYALECEADDFSGVQQVISEKQGLLSEYGGDGRALYYLNEGDVLNLVVYSRYNWMTETPGTVTFSVAGPIASGTELTVDQAADAKSGIPSNRYSFTISEEGNYGFSVEGKYDARNSCFSIFDDERNLLYEDLPLETALPLTVGTYSVLLSLSSDSDELSVTLKKPEKAVIRSGEMETVSWEQYNTGELKFYLKDGYEAGEIENRLEFASVGLQSTYSYVETNSDFWGGFITEVTIPEGVTVLGSGAFYGLSSLKEVELPSTLTSIGSLTFAGSGVEKVKLPEQINSIGCYAFADCESLTDISLPEGLTSIEYSTFANCESLCPVNIPEGVVRIEYSAFAGCTSLSEVALPDSVTELQYGSFYGCDSLKTFTVPANVLVMDSALQGSGVENVYVYTDTAEFSGAAFGGMLTDNYTQSGVTTSVVYQEGITVYGHLNSTAQAYCQSMGYTFALLVETKEAEIATVNTSEAGSAGVAAESTETAQSVAEAATTGLLALLADSESGSEEEESQSQPLTETEVEINDNVVAVTNAEALQKMAENEGTLQTAVVVNIVDDETEQTETAAVEQQTVQEAVNELNEDESANVEVVQTLDISVNLVASYKENEDTKTETVAQVKQSSEAMTFSVVLSNEQVEALKGKEIYVMRVHDGEVTMIPATLDGNVLSFASDRFSTYSIVTSAKKLISETKMDMDGDGKLNVQDVIHLVRYILGVSKNLFSSGDTNGDNMAIGLADVIHLLRAVMNSTVDAA